MQIGVCDVVGHQRLSPRESGDLAFENQPTVDDAGRAAQTKILQEVTDCIEIIQPIVSTVLGRKSNDWLTAGHSDQMALPRRTSAWGGDDTA